MGFEEMWARARAGGSLGRLGRVLPAAVDRRRGRAARVVPEAAEARGLAARDRRARQPVAWWDVPATGPGGAHRLPPRLRPRRRGVRRPARRGLRAGRDRPAARARRRAGAADRGRGVRRGGGLALRAGLPRLAAGDRGDRLGDARASCATATACCCSTRWPRPARRPVPGGTLLDRVGCFVELHVEQGRDLVDRGAAVGRGQRDLAARALPVRLHRRGQPCRDDADGGPARPDADLRDDRAGGQQAGPAGRAAGDVRAGRRSSPTAPTPCPSRVTALARRPRARPTPRSTELVDAITPAGAGAGRPRRHVADGDRRVGVGAVAFDADAGRAGSRADHAEGDWPVIPTAAGHDAGILSAAGIPTAMLFVRNPTGVSHSPAEHAETADCLVGVSALADTLERLVS